MGGWGAVVWQATAEGRGVAQPFASSEDYSALINERLAFVKIACARRLENKTDEART